jgi:alkylation response protein AidB-like acyl-CoA dehydrogenase
LNLSDSPGEAAFRLEVRAWLAENRATAPHLDPVPDGEQVTRWRRWSRRLYEAGYVGLSWPLEQGGRGLPLAYQAIWLEESARAEIPDHIGVIGLDMAGPTILHWGSAAQKARFVPPLMRGDEIWCQGFSEPDSGSDLAAIRTSAVLDDDAWVVNGQKVWSSFAHIADWCILLVRTDRHARKHAGLSYLLVDMHAPGITVVPLPQLTGDPEFNEIFFEDVRVPRDSILGGAGDGWQVAMTTLSHERGTHGIALAARLEADMQAALYLLSDELDGGPRPIADPIVADELARLWVELQALKITNLRSLATLARTRQPGPESTISKLHWSEINQRLAELVTRALGPAGLEHWSSGPADRARWSFARLRSRGNTIEAGTSEILRNIIAERVLGLPRSR